MEDGEYFSDAGYAEYGGSGYEGIIFLGGGGGGGVEFDPTFSLPEKFFPRSRAMRGQRGGKGGGVGVDRRDGNGVV